jgi:hypothetical protein
MRIHFIDATRPKFVAKQVRDGLNLFLDPALPRITLSGAQAVTARMFGYRDWHELARSIGTHPASPYDEDCDPQVVRSRLDYQAAALAIEGVFPEEATVIAKVLEPTSRTPGKASLMAVSPPKWGANVNLGKDPLGGVDRLDLKRMGLRSMLIVYKRMRIYGTTFHADPPRVGRLPKLRLKRLHFIPVAKPVPPDAAGLEGA